MGKGFACFKLCPESHQYLGWSAQLGHCYLKEYLFFFFFFSFRTALTAYGSSQAQGQIRAAAANRHHSHSSAGSQPHL